MSSGCKGPTGGITHCSNDLDLYLSESSFDDQASSRTYGELGKQSFSELKYIL